MAERLFVFVQFEFPWELGPPDGRYLLRAPATEEPEHVVVLETLAVAGGLRAGGRPRRRSRRAVEPEPEPATLPLTRATVIDPVSLSAERQARAWLGELDAKREVQAAAAVMNRVLYLHRIACADPYIRELSPEQALVIRAGWGHGEQVAGGRWLFARELPPPAGSRRRGRWPGGRRYSAALRPGERLAQLLSGRAEPLVCEELTLRARLDLDHDRLPHAAIGLHAAYAAAVPELKAERRQDLQVRIAELEKLAPEVRAQERAARGQADAQGGAASAGSDSEGAASAGSDSEDAASAGSGSEVAASAGSDSEDVARAGSDSEDVARDGRGEREPQAEVVRHALERLEAALRARTAGGLR